MVVPAQSSAVFDLTLCATLFEEFVGSTIIVVTLPPKSVTVWFTLVESK